MTSQVQICNRALSTYLGVARISNITETSSQATQCNLHYDDTLRGLFEVHEWNFANKRQALAELTNDRTEWAFKYKRPADALMIRWVNDAEAARAAEMCGMTPDTDREVTADAIYSDVQTAICQFTALLDDPTMYPQYFADALSAALAAHMAMSLTEDIKRATRAQEQAMAKLELAMVMDERNNPPVDYRDNPPSLAVRGL